MRDMPQDFARRLKEAVSARPPQRVHVEGARRAAVLIPIVGTERPQLLLTVRTDTLPSHRGQISFPGGSIDPADPTPAGAALREAQEEIGLEASAVQMIGEVDSIATFVSGYVIHPFVGLLERLPHLAPNPAEVAEVLLVPLDEVNETTRREPGFVHAGQTYPTEAWVWRGHVIWGATARVLRLLLRRLAEAGLAEDPGEDPPWGRAAGRSGKS